MKTTARSGVARGLVMVLLQSVLPGLAAAQGALDGQAVGGVEVPIDTPGEAEVLSTGRRALMPGVADLPLEEPLDPDTYICGSGDAFDLRFWGRQNLTIRLSVDLEGDAFIPKVGEVAVAGKTLADARRVVLAAVRRYYPGLQADLALAAPREFAVHVVGRVARSGVYRSNPRKRLSSLIGQAGGSTGSVRRVQIQRRDGTTITADLLLYGRTGDKRHNPYMLDGDVVLVPEPALEVTIAGPVRRPGRYELVSSKDLAELLELAGGLKSSAARTLPVRITRRNRAERKAALELRFGRGGEPPRAALHDDDEVTIPSTGELERSIVLVGAVVGADQADPATTIKRLSYIEGDTVRSVIERAGGVTVAADLRGAYIRRDGEALRSIDLESIVVRRDFRADRRIRYGDTIVVPFKRRSVVVEGAVVRSGNFQYNPRFGVREYVASAGGTTRYARDDHSIRVIGGDGKMRSYSPRLRVRPGDTIVVPERNFSRGEAAQILISGAGIVLSAVAFSYAVNR